MLVTGDVWSDILGSKSWWLAYWPCAPGQPWSLSETQFLHLQTQTKICLRSFSLESTVAPRKGARSSRGQFTVPCPTETDV